MSVLAGMQYEFKVPARDTTRAQAVSLSLLVAGFVFDAITPLGIAACLVYVLFVLSAAWFRSERIAFLFAAIGTLGTCLAYLIHADSTGSIDVMVHLNRFMTVMVLWLVAALIYSMRCALSKAAEGSKFQDLVFATMPNLVFIKDREFRIVQANDAFLSLYPEEDQERIIGYTTFEEYQPDEVEKILADDKYAFEHGYREIEESILFPDGSRRELVTKKVRFYSDHKPFLLGISHDVTELRLATEALEKSNQELEQFAFIASHDLQEPLRMVTNFTGLMNEEYGASLDDRARQYLAFTTSASQRMQALVADLLDYARLNVERQETVVFDIRSNIEQVIAALHQQIEESGATIEVTGDASVASNPVGFSRVIQNLIGNSIKYRSCARPVQLKISIEQRPAELLITVSDNGIGISEEYFDKIFEIFRRLHKNSEYTGTGIGLALCQRIVDNLGGRIWLESKPDVGSDFFFTIPTQAECIGESA